MLVTRAGRECRLILSVLGDYVPTVPGARTTDRFDPRASAPAGPR